MNILFLRPDPGNEQFGLGPFFRVEPLGLEYLAAPLLMEGHRVTIGDFRFRPGTAAWIRRTRPSVVGISCLHAPGASRNETHSVSCHQSEVSR